MTWAQVGRGVASAPRLLLIGLVRTYQLVISPLTGPRCKYYPSCSSYGLVALQRHGAIKGSALAGWRVLRCNPWSHGGVDDVPQVGEPLFRKREVSVRPHAEPVPSTPVDLNE
ncbi:membrane protein insertion efficiency factor YidD [Demequina zhanjiangensis]|uniref:Putative membrane protein insertion efficiency factor n=1 Tax=Demequina zhanjiangensis TaxID=3051659 RepID=A0ABT8G423_9MICO|nr:membrane protein insertion efficiency factor YidD [Demequina sp. SYSU T00b26]MDN4473880.1 membrane protein insertion efficiency factor YidD [Demequina sp. SYSU T00b26]